MTTSTGRAEAKAADARLPMALTWARVIGGGVAAGLALLAYHRVFVAGTDTSGVLYMAAFAVFTLAALTDAADGIVARRTGTVTRLGAALDHAADKAASHVMLLVLAATVLPMDQIIAAALIVGRDAIIGGLREGLGSGGGAPPVGPLGKVKTAAVMTGAALALLLQGLALGGLVELTGGVITLLEVLSHLVRIALWLGAAAALVSAAQYFSAMKPSEQPPA